MFEIGKAFTGIYKISHYGGKWWLYNKDDENERYMFDTKKQLLKYTKDMNITVKE